MNVAYSYLWRLPVGDIALVREIVEQLRQCAITMGADDVSDLVELKDDDADRISPDAIHVVIFTAKLPTVSPATLPRVKGEQYGLASSDGTSWAWSGVVRVTSFREIGDLIDAAADLGVQTQQSFGGVVITAKKNDAGEVEYDQHYALQVDLENF